MRRVAFGLVLTALLAGCSSGPSASYQDGYSGGNRIAHTAGFAPKASPPRSPTTQCARLARNLPGHDNKAQWKAGCDAAVAKSLGQ